MIQRIDHHQFGANLLKIRSFLIASLAMLYPCVAGAAAPKAVLTAPGSVAVGQLALLQFSGSNPDGTTVSTVSDVDPILIEAIGPSVSPLYFYDKAGHATAAIFNPSTSGTYLFVLAAVGTPQGASAVSYDFATVVIQVGTQPNPTPPVPPGPTPAPTDGVALGAAYIPMFASSNAAAWSAYADALDAGKSIPDAKTAFKAAQQGIFNPWVDANVAPMMVKILPENTSPTADQIKALSAFARDVAKGSKSPVVWRQVH